MYNKSDYNITGYSLFGNRESGYMEVSCMATPFAEVTRGFVYDVRRSDSFEVLYRSRLPIKLCNWYLWDIVHNIVPKHILEQFSFERLFSKTWMSSLRGQFVNGEGFKPVNSTEYSPEWKLRGGLPWLRLQVNPKDITPTALFAVQSILRQVQEYAPSILYLRDLTKMFPELSISQRYYLASGLAYANSHNSIAQFTQYPAFWQEDFVKYDLLDRWKLLEEVSGKTPYYSRAGKHAIEPYFNMRDPRNRMTNAEMMIKTGLDPKKNADINKWYSKAQEQAVNFYGHVYESPYNKKYNALSVTRNGQTISGLPNESVKVFAFIKENYKITDLVIK